MTKKHKKFLRVQIVNYHIVDQRNPNYLPPSFLLDVHEETLSDCYHYYKVTVHRYEREYILLDQLESEK